MPHYEYKVVPAPTRGVKAKGLKGTQARFAHALETVMNDLGAQGWEYQRTDTLPVEERQGLRGTTSSFQNMLVFRRPLPDATAPEDVAVGLIEDQSAKADPATPQPEVTTDEPLEVDPETTTDTASDATPEAAEAEAETGPETDADKPPFAFPWNRKPSGTDTKDARDPKDDRKDPAGAPD